MPYQVLIRKNSTGEIRSCQIDWDWDDALYWWTDGNYGCDCNRFLAFERSIGNDPSPDEAKCGSDQYSALKAILPDGTEIQIDTRSVP